MEKFDAIIVGAGPAGLSAAHVLAKAGLKIIVFERGEYPGSKNVMGGVLYSHVTEDIIPGFAERAPLERPVTEQRYWFTGKESHVSVGYKSGHNEKEPYNAYTVLRAKFDHWFAGEVEKAGALIITETVVKEIIYEGDKAVGVRTGRDEGEVYADVVILAEGVNCLLAQQVQFQGHISTRHLAVAVKEVIALPRGVIEDRFNLEKGQGVAIELIGENTKGMIGTGFIYTNKDSLSVGVGAILSQMMDKEINPNELLEQMKAHPSVRPLIEGGESKEYMAHLIPEGGYKAMPKLYGHGVLVVGDAAMLVNAIHREGSNLAMTSGKVAAETVIEAKKKGNFYASTLAIYQERLETTFVLKDLKKYQNLHHFLGENPHFFEMYPEMANNLAREFFTVDSVPKKEKQARMMSMVKENRSLWKLGQDMYRLWRVLG